MQMSPKSQLKTTFSRLSEFDIMRKELTKEIVYSKSKNVKMQHVRNIKIKF